MDTNEAETRPDMHRPVSLWRNRNFVLLWSGQLVSFVGSNVSGVAMPLLVLAITHSAAQAGIVGALAYFPYLVVSLPAGVAVDRWNRRGVMIACDAARAVALGSIPVALWIGHVSLLQLYLVALAEGTLLVFFNLAETTALIAVVPEEQLGEAIGRNSVIDGAGTLAGPALAGFLYGVVGRAFPFLADAVSYALSVISLLFISVPFKTASEPAPLGNLWREMATGFVWLRNRPFIVFLALLRSAANAMFVGFYLIFIVLARHMHTSPALIGLALALAGGGSMLGAATANAIQGRLGLERLIKGWCWVTTVLWLALALAPNLVALAAVALLMFILYPVYDIAQVSYRLPLIPNEMQGRVNSAVRLIAFGGQPVGILLAGASLQWLGPRQAAFVFCGLLAVMSVVATVVIRSRQRGRLIARAPQVNAE